MATGLSTLHERPFFNRVESLRGICAALVAGYHVSGWGAPAGMLLPHQPWIGVGPLQNAIGRVELHLFSGHAALMVFFVISGLVLRISLQYGPQEFGRAAVRFHVARFFRIYPIVIFAMFIAAIAHQWQLPGGLPLTPSIFVANLLLLDVSLNNTLWAIQLEVVMAPLIVLLYFLERRQGPWVLVPIAVISSVLAFSGKWALWQPLSEYFFAFVLGMLMPTLGRKWVMQLSQRAVNGWLAVALLGLFLPWWLFGFYSKFSAIIEGYAAAVLVSFIAYRLDIASGRFLDWQPVRKLGLSSGSFYVLHMSVLPAIVPLVADAIPLSLCAELPALTGPLVIMVSLALYAPIALLSYYTVEAPGIALGRRAVATAALVAAE